MNPVLPPPGLDPLGVWDSRDSSWFADPQLRADRNAWAEARRIDTRSTYRAEFYLLDEPFAVVHMHVRDADGTIVTEGGEPVTERVVVMLDELPPAHLLA